MRRRTLILHVRVLIRSTVTSAVKDGIADGSMVLAAWTVAAVLTWRCWVPLCQG